MPAYPYLPTGRTFLFAPEDNSFMKAAEDYARVHSKDHAHPTGSVVVKDGVIIGQGANGSEYHATHGCERKRQGIPTGQGYELCEGCHPRNHSEPRAIADANAHGGDTNGADLYLWGHWWACEPCWNAIIAAGIRDVYILEGSDTRFAK